MKNQFKIKSVKDAISIREAASKNYVDTFFNHRSMINNAHVEFNDKSLDNVKFVKANSLPAVSQHLTPKEYLDNDIDEPTLVRINQDNYFNLNNINSITLTTQSVNDNQVNNKSYVVLFHQEKTIQTKFRARLL